MIQLEDLLATTGGVLSGLPTAREFADFCYDSRLAASGQLFLAVKTERRDGHAFIADAVRGGCTGVLCERPPADCSGVTVIVVDDVRLAIQQWASAMLRRYHPTTIGVTGSVGKTSTRRAIATLLAGLAPTFASRRSFNSLFGLPIALGRLEPHHRFAVLEMGLDRFGEMRRLTELFPPRFAVVTNVAPTHLHYLRDEEHIAAEKAALVRALPPDGTAILNADDPRVAAMADQHPAGAAGRVVRYGLAASASHADHIDLLATNIDVSLDGTRFDLLVDGDRYAASLPLVGRHHVYTALAALALARECGLALSAAIERLRLIERQAGRLNPLPGYNGCTLLDDTYNASPASMHAALETLAALAPRGTRRRIAVLGDMLELGDAAVALHQEVGTHAVQVADVVIAKGDLAANMVVQALENGGDATPEMIVTHAAADAIEAVRQRVQFGDIVLVKGSAEARMEAVVAGLIAPRVDTAALVRQERSFDHLRIASPDRPTWLEIDLDAIADNTRRIQAIVGPHVRLMTTLKADAYGHGAVRVARTVVQQGVFALAVATLGEAVVLREAAITAPILILGYTPPWQVREALRHGVRLTVFDTDVAREISAAAQELQVPAIVHVKVDTGMARLGLQPPEVLPFLHYLRELPGITVEGLFTHFATADSADERFAREQLRRFDAMLRTIEAESLRPPLVHAANSAAILRFPAAHYDLVRPGLALYGLSPSAETPISSGFRPALSFKTEIAQVKTLPPGSPVSYGGAFVTQRVSRIATIPVGYADGFRRSPSWRCVLLHGQRVPVVGRVAMDYAMLDVTDVPGVCSGDEVVLIGRQGAECISVEEVADWLGTINYEVIATILPRVPRMV
ncbi:MAG TPA: alanine racemase [Herpetosiphonaceae bacterium]